MSTGKIPKNHGRPSVRIASLSVVAALATATLLGSSPSVATAADSQSNTFQTQTLTVVQYIDPFRPDKCIDNLQKSGKFSGNAAVGLCTGLSASANIPAPKEFSSFAYLKDWIDLREYRGFQRFPSYEYKCVDGRLVNGPNQVAKKDNRLVSWGYTKVLSRKHLGDKYTEDPTYNKLAPEIIPREDGFSVRLSWASRLSNGERKAQFKLSGYDAPFISAEIEASFSCSGEGSATVRHNNFPSTAMYANGRLDQTSPQSDDIFAFLEQGGRSYHRAGQGTLAGPFVTDTVSLPPKQK